MKTFRVDLSRNYAVEIEAENEQKARELAEFFLGLPSDAGTDAERKLRNYKINNVEITANEACFSEEITD